ncbi:MAG: DUF86 domain-containing protein [Propionibacteriaceae bacterium]|jgi:uncharacterized protein with HEPN domain|nr:DUF86 domain-containing protein [Propionibacteriaceae bacterium]
MTEKLTRYLNDFLIHADRASRLVAKGRSAFDEDEYLRYAAEALLVRLGEIIARIDQNFPDLAEHHPELELRQLKGTRNIIAHGYDIVDYDIVWEVMSIDIPRVAVRVVEMLTPTITPS